MLKRVLSIAVWLFLSLPAVSLAEGTVIGVTGSSFIKEPGQDWHELKKGDPLKDGITIRIEASSSIVMNVGNDLIEFLAGLEGDEITIAKVIPFEFTIKGVEVRHLNLPSLPVLLSPLERFRSLDGSPEFLWSVSKEDAFSHIQISPAPDFTKMILDERVPDSNKKIDGLVKGKYYWRVSAISKKGLEGGFSEARAFDVKPVPEPPTLMPPASTKTSTTFRWKRKGEGERYRLQISKTKEFSETIVDLKNIEGPRVTIGTLDEGDYLVRVSSIDEDGLEGRFSEPQSFYVGPRVPSPDIGPLMIMFGVVFMLLGL